MTGEEVKRTQRELKAANSRAGAKEIPLSVAAFECRGGGELHQLVQKSPHSETEAKDLAAAEQEVRKSDDFGILSFLYLLPHIYSGSD